MLKTLMLACSLALLSLPLAACGCHLHVTTLRALPGDLALALSAFASTDDFTDDFHVCFQNGATYRNDGVGGTLFLEGGSHNHPNHAKGGRVVWRPADPSGPSPILIGGSPLETWYRCNDGVHCPWNDWNGVFVHYVNEIANLTAPFLPVRNLWVDGSRVSRASVDGLGLGWTATPDGYASTSAVPASYASDKVELVWPRVIRNWIAPRCVVSAVDGHNLTVSPACWKELIARNRGKLPPVPTRVENIVAPPGPGEFVATNDYVFYRPPSSSPYTPPSNAFVGVTETILAGHNLTNHAFMGLTFSHTSWTLPSSSDGYVPSQTLVTPEGGEPVGAVHFAGSNGISFTNDTFAHIGAPYALSVGSASQGVLVDDCHFYDLSGGAVKIGNVDDLRAVSTRPVDQDRNMVVSRNRMSDVSVEYAGGAAVFAGYVANTTISHNEIRRTGYTGISLGWGWGNHVSGPQTFASDNHVVGNLLVDVMSSLNDGGCTYTLGPQPRSTVSGNFCDSDHAPVVGCFYHDNGSRYFTTTKNVCTTSPATPCVYLQGCCNAPAYDIAVSNLWCRDTGAVRNGCEKERCTIDPKTLYVLPKGAPWPKEAQEIVDAAGR